MDKEELYSFIMKHTKSDNKEEMKQLLEDLSKRQEKGQLNKIYLMSICSRALSYINDESVDEVKNVIFSFFNK